MTISNVNNENLQLYVWIGPNTIYSIICLKLENMVYKYEKIIQYCIANVYDGSDITRQDLIYSDSIFSYSYFEYAKNVFSSQSLKSLVLKTMW